MSSMRFTDLAIMSVERELISKMSSMALLVGGLGVFHSNSHHNKVISFRRLVFNQKFWPGARVIVVGLSSVVESGVDGY